MTGGTTAHFPHTARPGMAYPQGKHHPISCLLWEIMLTMKQPEREETSRVQILVPRTGVKQRKDSQLNHRPKKCLPEG